jgi:hypothetical protein
MTSDSEDLAQVAADDAWLDAVSAGAAPSADLELVLQWRQELMAAPVPAQGPNTLRATRGGRRTGVLVGAAFVAVVAMTGTAAALGGSTGPLAPVHRVLFGHDTSKDKPALARVRVLVEQAAARISEGRRSGGIEPKERAAISAQLDEAQALLGADQEAGSSELRARAQQLRRALAALPALPAAPHAPVLAPVPGPTSAPRPRSHGIVAPRHSAPEPVLTEGSDREGAPADDDATASPVPTASAADEPEPDPTTSDDAPDAESTTGSENGSAGGDSSDDAGSSAATSSFNGSSAEPSGRS